MIDQVIRDSIAEVVGNHGQPEEVAKLVANWYEQVIVGNEVVVGDAVANKNNAFAHLDRVFEAMWSPNGEALDDVE